MEIRTKQFQILTDIELVWQLMTDVYDHELSNGPAAPFFEYAVISSWMDKDYLRLNRFWLDGDLPVAFVFYEQPVTLNIPRIPGDSFEKKLYSTYLSYLPKEKVAYPLKMNVDQRGSFTELVHLQDCGQVSINISKPGITKGQHWHHTKWEFFIVVAGHGLIQERKIDSDEVIEFEVSGENIQCVHMLPGYTHNIINLSDTENLVTVMYCNEIFNPDKPDTYFLPVQ